DRRGPEVRRVHSDRTLGSSTSCQRRTEIARRFACPDRPCNSDPYRPSDNRTSECGLPSENGAEDCKGRPCEQPLSTSCSAFSYFLSSTSTYSASITPSSFLAWPSPPAEA